MEPDPDLPSINTAHERFDKTELEGKVSGIETHPSRSDEKHSWRPRKVVIVGAGAVGSTFAYALAQSGLADEITLRDANHELAMGQVLDLAHGQAFFPSVQIREAHAVDYADAHMIVITAGAKQRPGESRLDLLQRNVKIIHDIIDEIVLQKSPAVVLIVSNPVDILTYVATNGPAGHADASSGPAPCWIAHASVIY
jgi:hypothetical protein